MTRTQLALLKSRRRFLEMEMHNVYDSGDRTLALGYMERLCEMDKEVAMAEQALMFQVAA